MGNTSLPENPGESNSSLLDVPSVSLPEESNNSLPDEAGKSLPVAESDRKPIPSSEESSNDAPEQNMKLKNTILRNCFASLHRRQQMEKEQEYKKFFNGGFD